MERSRCINALSLLRYLLAKIRIYFHITRESGVKSAKRWVQVHLFRTYHNFDDNCGGFRKKVFRKTLRTLRKEDDGGGFVGFFTKLFMAFALTGRGPTYTTRPRAMPYRVAADKVWSERRCSIGCKGVPPVELAVRAWPCGERGKTFRAKGQDLRGERDKTFGAKGQVLQGVRAWSSGWRSMVFEIEEGGRMAVVSCFMSRKIKKDVSFLYWNICLKWQFVLPLHRNSYKK